MAQPYSGSSYAKYNKTITPTGGGAPFSYTPGGTYTQKKSTTATTPTIYSNQEPAISLVSEGGGYSSNYTPISIPNLNIKLTSQQIAELLKQAEMYGELGYSPALSQIDENITLSEQAMNKNIEGTRPDYWTAMQDVTQSAANAVSRFLQNTNAIGRTGGLVSSGVGDIEGAGVEGVTGLEKELNKRIASSRLSHQEYTDAQDRLKVGIQKEKGLSVALKNIELQENALDTARWTAQQNFQNALASSQDAQQWEQINLAIQQFETNTQVMMEELGIKKQQASAELQSTQLENELLQRSINAPSYNNAAPTMVNTSMGPMTQEQALKWGFAQPGQYYSSGTSDLDSIFGLPPGTIASMLQNN
jgi:hypothetical protein